MSYQELASKESVQATIEALKARGINAVSVPSKAEALAYIKKAIPAGASVMNGSSRTLEEVGFVEYLKSGTHGWNNLHEAILAEKDPAKQAVLRRQSVLSDYYLGSVHAVAQTGEIVIASNTGSQLSHVVYTSPNVLFVVSTKKITPTLEGALKRLWEHVVPLEDTRLMAAYGMHTAVNKELVIRGEPGFLGRKIEVVFVEESLGF